MLTVYEFDAATVENGDQLESNKIPIFMNGKSDRILHCTPLNYDSIVCSLTTDGSDSEKMAILKLGYGWKSC